MSETHTQTDTASTVKGGPTVPDSPRVIDRSKVNAFLDDLGIDRSQLRSITLDYRQASLEYLVRGDGGVLVNEARDGPMTKVVGIPIR